MYRKGFMYLSTIIIGLCALHYGVKEKATALAYLPVEEKELSSKEDGIYELTIDTIMDEDQNIQQVDGVESIKINELEKGTIAIWITYDSTEFGISKIQVGTRNPIDAVEQLHYLGDIYFTNKKEKPYIRMVSDSLSIGIGTKDFIIPTNIYDFLPIKINNLGLYECKGALIIQKYDTIEESKYEIDLDDIQLDKYSKVMMKESKSTEFTMEIVSNYSALLPLEEQSIPITIPLKIQYQIHD